MTGLLNLLILSSEKKAIFWMILSSRTLAMGFFTRYRSSFVFLQISFWVKTCLERPNRAMVLGKTWCASILDTCVSFVVLAVSHIVEVLLALPSFPWVILSSTLSLFLLPPMLKLLLAITFSSNFLLRLCLCPPPVLSRLPYTGNTFDGTNKVEFYSATATTWSTNETPVATCTKLVVGVDNNGGKIPASTFTYGTNGLPSTYDC